MDEDGRLDHDASRVLIFSLLNFAKVTDPICKYVSCETLCITSYDRSKNAIKIDKKFQMN